MATKATKATKKRTATKATKKRAAATAVAPKKRARAATKRVPAGVSGAAKKGAPPGAVERPGERRRDRGVEAGPSRGRAALPAFREGRRRRARRQAATRRYHDRRAVAARRDRGAGLLPGGAPSGRGANRGARGTRRAPRGEAGAPRARGSRTGRRTLRCQGHRHDRERPAPREGRGANALPESAPRIGDHACGSSATSCEREGACVDAPHPDAPDEPPANTLLKVPSRSSTPRTVGQRAVERFRDDAPTSTS